MDSAEIKNIIDKFEKSSFPCLEPGYNTDRLIIFLLKKCLDLEEAVDQLQNEIQYIQNNFIQDNR